MADQETPVRTSPRAHAEAQSALVEQVLHGVEQQLLGITRRWLSRTLVSGAATLTSCSAPTPADAGPSHVRPRLPDASPTSSSEDEQTRSARAREAERALLAEQLLPGPKGQPVNVTTPAPGGGKPLKCREDEPLFPVRASGLSVEGAPEYLELRSLRLSGEGRSAVQEFTVVDRFGTPCASASNDQCRSKLAGRVSEAHASICVDMCVGHSVVTSQGDEVKQWSGPAELRQLLGDIVSDNDALLLVASSGYQLECGNPARSTIRKLKDGFEIYATRTTNTCAPVEATRYRLQVSTRGELRELDKLVVSRNWDVCIGREPTGLIPVPVLGGGSALGDFLAHCARLEEASVYAFERMVLELTALGAPSALIERARAAADDERGHAAVVGQLARARGGRVQAAQVAPATLRNLEQIALENAVEGCVRETYGALVGAYQASHALDLALRTSMAAIAQDEARHASLSHALHGWLLQLLEPEACERVRCAQRAAVKRLRDACATLDREPWHAQVGLPPRPAAEALIDELTRELWHVAA
jgi:hypothetical protein